VSTKPGAGQPDGSAEHLQVLQQRVCFTELAINELDRHAATFGPITLSFGIDQLRQAGLTPVRASRFWCGFAQPDRHLLRKSCVAYSIRLRATPGFKGDERSGHPAARFGYPLEINATFNLTNTDPAGNVVANYPVPVANVNSIMRYVGYRNIPFDHSIGMLTVFLNIFYPTDNTHSGELLGYYRQREWRLIGGGLDFNGRPMARSLTPAEADRLVTIDQSFWSRELTIEGNAQARSTLARMYDPIENWNFFDLVQNIFVPRSIADRAFISLGLTYHPGRTTISCFAGTVSASSVHRDARAEVCC
jgi:hypothetical protein